MNFQNFNDFQTKCKIILGQENIMPYEEKRQFYIYEIPELPLDASPKEKRHVVSFLGKLRDYMEFLGFKTFTGVPTNEWLTFAISLQDVSYDLEVPECLKTRRIITFGKE